VINSKTKGGWKQAHFQFNAKTFNFTLSIEQVIKEKNKQ